MVGVDPERLSARESVDGRPLSGREGGRKVHRFVCGGYSQRSSGLVIWSKLCQILTNLVGNALKFTPRRGRVTVDALAEAGGTTLSVQDTGPGIGVEDQKENI